MVSVREGPAWLVALAVLLVGSLAVVPAHADIYLGRTDTGSLVLTNEPVSNGGFETLTLLHKSSRDSANMPDLETLESIVATASERYSLPEELIYAVIYVESDGDTTAVSHEGAVGLMQLMPETARKLGVENPRDPAQNVEGGARYLHKLMRRFDGDLNLVLASYNAGPTAVDRHGGVPPYHETREFVDRVKNQFKRFKGEDDMIYTYRDENGTVHVSNIR